MSANGDTTLRERMSAEADGREVVEADIAELERSAQHLLGVGRPDEAAHVTAQADVLRAPSSIRGDPLASRVRTTPRTRP